MREWIEGEGGKYHSKTGSWAGDTCMLRLWSCTAPTLGHGRLASGDVRWYDLVATDKLTAELTLKWPKGEHRRGTGLIRVRVTRGLEGNTSLPGSPNK